MSDNNMKCLVCEQTSQQIPLLTLNYADQEYHICPGHLPILIHHPEELISKLPGAANIVPHEH